MGASVLREWTVQGFGSDADWVHKKDYLYGPMGMWASRAQDGEVHYFHRDHLGSTRTITDSNGNKIGRRDYYPYGRDARDGTGQYDQRMAKYTGHERDPHNLSDYMLARTYAYPLRRFMTPDPARDGWNLYGYVSGNPMNRIDPDGLLQKDANGEMVAELGERARRRHDGDTAEPKLYNVHNATLKANDETPIEAHTVLSGAPKVGLILAPSGTQNLPNSDNPVCTNCHGTTFADGKYWIENNQVDKILTGDGYEPITGAAQVGDVVIYRVEGKVKHSARVASVDERGRPVTVNGLSGTATKPRVLPIGPGIGTAWEDPAQVSIYRN